jgi:hypothetical protein
MDHKRNFRDGKGIFLGEGLRMIKPGGDLHIARKRTPRITASWRGKGVTAGTPVRTLFGKAGVTG